MIVDGEGQKYVILKRLSRKNPKRQKKRAIKLFFFQTILIKFCNKPKKLLILIVRKQSVTTQALLVFPKLLMTADGPRPSICLTACLLALRAAQVPAFSQFPPVNILHVPTLFPWDVHWVHEWICKPVSTCFCCRGWEEWVWLTLLT